MKKLLFLLLPLAFLASCQPDYHNKIEKADLQSSVYKQGPLIYLENGGITTEVATLDSISKGYVDTVRISTQYDSRLGAVGSYNFTHKKVMLKKTGYQNWVDFWHTAWRIISAILGVILLFGGLYKYMTLNNNNKNTRQEGTSTMIWLIPVFVGCVMLAAGIYPWSSEGYETKAQYDANQAKDGDQRAYDWNNVEAL